MHIVLSVFCFLGIPGISILREVIVKGEQGDRGPEGKMGSVGPKGEPGDSSSINGKGFNTCMIINTDLLNKLI